MFHRDKKGSVPLQVKSIKDLTRMVAPAQFLAEERRQNLLTQMRELSGLEESRYESLCNVLLENFVHHCQNLPETSNSFYAQLGGLVDHALNRTEAALGLFKEFLIFESPDVLTEEQKLWQYALYTAAILKGIGKLYIDYKVDLYDANGQLLKQWNPLLESLSQFGTYYYFEFQKESDLEFRKRLNLLLAKALMPQSGFSWIASNPEVLAVWLALLNEDEQSAGTLGVILIRAEAIAIQRYFNEFLIKSSAMRSSRSRRIGAFSGGTPDSLADKEQLIGVEFILWLNKALTEGKVMINKSPLFMVPGGMLMSQEMFQLFVREHPEYKNWQAVQNGFLALGLHKAGVGGNVTSRFEQTSSQQIHDGIVFSDYAIVLPAEVKVHQAATGKAESMSAIELVHKAQYTSQFTQQPNVIAVPPLQNLTTKGLWQAIEQNAAVFQAGAKRVV